MTDPVIISKDDALKAGYKRFFTGEACTHGHVAERYVYAGLCVDCAKLRNKAASMARKALREEIKRKRMEIETPCYKTHREDLREYIRQLDERIASLRFSEQIKRAPLTQSAPATAPGHRLSGASR